MNQYWVRLARTVSTFLCTALFLGLSHEALAQSSPELRFTEVEGTGLDRTVLTSLPALTIAQQTSYGAAAADFDNDGDIDLYVVGGIDDPSALYLNDGNGRFTNVAREWGVELLNWGGAPAFGDIDGDGDLDLFVGSVERGGVYMFENQLHDDDTSEEFVDITAQSGISMTVNNTISATFADYNNDGLLDLFLAHWGARKATRDSDTETLWKNEGGGLFSNVSTPAGFSSTLVEGQGDHTFTPNLVDLNGDGNIDLLMAADLNESQVYMNMGNETFLKVTDREVIKDQAGMGAAVGDFDNDGDFDWFVTSIYNRDSGGGSFGNRLYEYLGAGRFKDITEQAQVANGNWGWGACTQDFDHDGDLDIFHSNGFPTLGDYQNKPSRFFRNRGDGTFNEVAVSIGLDDTEQGRGVGCFDFDRDGDIDILLVNATAPHLILYRNDSSNLGNYITFKLKGSNANSFGVGAVVRATTTHGTHIRQLGGSNNFVSHDPLEVHFGLGDATAVSVEVTWPDQTVTHHTFSLVNQIYTLKQPIDINSLLLNVQFGDGDGTYSVGDVVDIEADEPPEGYYFSHWSTSGAGTFGDSRQSNTTFTIPAELTTITAHFLPGVGPDANVSVARRWNEVTLAAIRNDYARPTVHARNLFHISAAMYDIWAALVTNIKIKPETWLLGNTENSGCEFDTETANAFDESDIETALSYAALRMIQHRFSGSPSSARINRDANSLMGFLELDPENFSSDLETGSAASLGNYTATCYLTMGSSDGANEADDYKNKEYLPVNPPLEPELPGNPNIVDLNRWQPLALSNFIDQAGNPIQEQPEFLSPEWGAVTPFSLQESDRTYHSRGDQEYQYSVYHDPGEPPTIDGALKEEYQWSHSLVSVWSSHLDPTMGRGADLIDISPAGIGNLSDSQYPTTFYGHRDFFLDSGLDPGPGYTLNPITEEPYEPQMVPLGDYARVLAEFWADGPDSETPPGHWFVILNSVNEHPDSTRKLNGEGLSRPELEWDVIGYFVLGGAMHDSAITAWGIKGWYDYIRPISSIRAMADLGQSSDPDAPSYHEDGIPLKPGYIELVESGDELAGEDDADVGKIKILAWRGPDYIEDPVTDVAGVGWILAENWWPYQRPTFVTPPFAGYVSGHSTYSRAAAEVLTLLTGSKYFPGGMSSFEVERDNFLVFEKGPSVSLTLQWATYQDAADQCSLSRIWGGIHPPIDDIPGRLIGSKIGKRVFEHAMTYIEPEDQVDESIADSE